MQPNKNGKPRSGFIEQDLQVLMYLQLSLWQWGAGNVYILVLSSWKVNIAENPFAVIRL